MEVLQAFERAGAVLLDHHFVYSGGDHGPHYINADFLFPKTELMNIIVDEMTMPWIHKAVEVVAGPPIGGLVLSTMAASNWLGPRAPELVWPDKDGKEFFFDRAGFAARLEGKRVLIYEDLLNSGGSVEKVKKQVELRGGIVVGVTVMCNRGIATAESLGVECLEAQSTVKFDKFEPDKCPLCKEGRPIVEDIGHGHSYKEEHPEYEGGYIKLLS